MALVVDVEYGHVRSVNQTIELYEARHIVVGCPSGDTICELVLKGSQTQGDILSLKCGLNRWWVWVDNGDGKRLTENLTFRLEKGSI